MLLVAGAAQGTGGSCDAADCLRRIGTRAAVTLEDASPRELAGVWTNGGGLAGSTLHLFADGTYIFSQWADIQPETIYDKGRWNVRQGVVRMSSDREITWDPESDRRYLCLKHDELGLVLLGIDVSLQRLEELADANPDLGSGSDWLGTFSFTRSRRLSLRQERSIRAQLFRDSWKPQYFKASQ